jgi:hypothetical protein
MPSHHIVASVGSMEGSARVRTLDRKEHFAATDAAVLLESATLDGERCGFGAGARRRPG